MQDEDGKILLTSLRVGLSLLRDHTFRHNFEDNLNPLRSCSIKAETALYYYTYGTSFSSYPETFHESFQKSLPSLSRDKLISVLLYGSDAFDSSTNSKILNCTLKFMKDSHRFDDSLF